jgi:hypothetical protein
MKLLVGIIIDRVIVLADIMIKCSNTGYLFFRRNVCDVTEC